MPPPLRGKMMTDSVGEFVAAFRKHDVAKSHCGRRALAWYDAQAKVLRK